jgi:benzoyl-CoA 2,3-dioxygenase component B
VGETGILRVVDRTAQTMADRKVDHPDDVRRLGAIDLPTIQKYLNLWYSLSLDLFGGEISSNAASFFAAGLKGRAKEEQFADHRALDQTYGLEVPGTGGSTDGSVEGGGSMVLTRAEVPLRNAMNEVLRDAYAIDCQRGVDKWNRAIRAHGIPFELALPSRRFHRHIGVYAALRTDPLGNLMRSDVWEAKRENWLPSEADKAFVKSLMYEPIFGIGQMASWIGAPKQGIRGRPVSFEYVRHGEQ